ncbi:MAG: FAD-dependent oxidoreductase [Pyrinomonadaceae bacterium]
MARILILGGGFGGVVAAEQLARELAPEHEITLVSRSDNFVFYPSLVRVAFGKCEPADVSFPLRTAMLGRRINFVHAEVARIDPESHLVTVTGDEFRGDLGYDYLIYALGRRLATERVSGFFEHAHHLLSVESARRFRTAVDGFTQGQALIGACAGARLSVPVYETAFALSRLLRQRSLRDKVKISVLLPDQESERFGGPEFELALEDAMNAHQIELVPDFPVEHISPGVVETADHRYLKYDLLALVPPFAGASPLHLSSFCDADGFIQVDRGMQVMGVPGLFAVGDCVAFTGPKLGHMAVRQAAVAAANLADQIAGRPVSQTYDHELMLVIDEGGRDSIYAHGNLWDDDELTVHQGRFWSWAKRVQQRYWQATHK